MTEAKIEADRPDRMRCNFMLGAALSGAALAVPAQAAGPAAPVSAGPIRPGRDTQLQGKVAVVTGAARGIGAEFEVTGGDSAKDA